MISLPLLFCLILSPLAGMAVDPIFVNNGTINFLTNVDATTVVNKGTWNPPAVLTPFETSDTLNYTNTGSISATLGWNFDFNPSANGQRGWSAIFFNDNPGVIQAIDGEILNPPNSPTPSLVSYLLVSATNIINKGLLEASANGEMVLNGQNVLLGRSFLQIVPITGVGSSNTKTNFTPDTAIYDLFWSAGVSNVLTVAGSPWNGTSIGTFTAMNAGEPCGVTANIAIGPFTPQLADSYSTNTGSSQLTLTNMDFTTTNVTVFSNSVRQAIFVFTGDTNITATDSFSPSLISTNPFQTAEVQLSTVSTNLVTLTLQTSSIFLVDDLASSTNRGLLPSTVQNPALECTSPTFRPSSVVVSRIDPNPGGVPGMGPPSPTFFYDPLTFSNFVANGIADAYSGTVDNLAAEPAFGQSITNAPGRIQISANNLNLSQTRMSAQAQIMIQASNLISSAGAVMDCQNLSYNLGSTNGVLNVVNLSGTTVQRLNGTITEWSGLWTNYIVNVFPNFVTNTAAGGSMPSNITNVTEVDMAITVVNASGLTTTRPVIVQDLALHSTNMIVSDFMTVDNTLLFDGQSLTIQNGGGLVLNGTVQDWNSATAPTLRFFTNNGVLEIPNNAHFGDDGPTNYAAFVNHGSISSAGQTINSRYLEINGGEDGAESANFEAICQTGLVMNAQIFAAGDIQFFANTLQIDPSTLSANGAIDFTVTNSLSDGGFAAGNNFSCQNGFNLFIKPAAGDLLGTTLTDTALVNDEVDHVWAGHDFGTNVVGYSNNVAIGTLILNQDSALFEPLFHFTGASTANGLYVNNLDLSTLTDYTNELEIDPNLVIYFISANLDTNVVITPSPSAEAFLNGQFGGHLRWVQGVTLSNTKISGSLIAGGKFQLSFTGSGSPGQTNVVEASTNLVNWVPIYTNLGSLIFTDAAANGFSHRFYRVESSP